MTKKRNAPFQSGADTDDYRRRDDPYGIERRKHEVFVPPQMDDDTAYVPDQDVHAARGETQKRIARRKLRHRRRALARRRQLRRRRRRLTAIAAVFFLFLVWLFLRLAPVPFGTLVIEGNDTMTTDDVYKACGIKNGLVNVIQLSPAEMRERMSQDLRVADADISREFPLTIHVRMSERQTVAVVTTMYGFAYIDASGTVIETAPQIKGVSVPLITGKKMDTLLLGDKLDDPAIIQSLLYLQALTPELRKEITEINVGTPDSIIVYTSDSIPIHLGSGDDPEERAAITGELLQEIQRNQLAVQYIDTDPAAPLVKSS